MAIVREREKERPPEPGMPGPEDRKRETMKVALVGLIVNLVLIVLKIVGGIIGNSQAVFADGIHSGSDLITDLMLLVGLSFWARPKDSSHPYGHERIETLTALALAAVLFGVGIFVAYDAATQILERHIVRLRMIALYAALTSMVFKELLYRWTRAAGTRMKSLVVLANAWHHRSDALSSIPVAVAVFAAILVPSWWLIDHVAALVVSVFIMYAAYRIALPCMRQLVDTAPPKEIQSALRETIELTDGVISVHEVKARYLGQKILAEAHIEVDGRNTVEEGHGIAEEAKRNVFKRFPEIEDITIHVEPMGDFAMRGEP